ncbi:VOC family protein [Burkholderia vietnamiensis]|uniref:VOC family protein n=1 Tax=Burkholderia vietnamiensis TaxID=60552 RepID=UPI0008422BDD|nr:VOC family protein [Burkholderia vietnamiensis]AOK00284.1 glyoxalase [Burkholderia vietnamiensis]MBR7908855.1 VOC family protein [Burkholderia vietnamiensis]MBR8230531.1 VOC family protein [Burkholderia vietnamiensis]MCO1349472.1 VOC family protein [Burkholderia vietnamiensis]MCO1431943.1 VOC family protein [Burkholderia vietnamiensis]
MNIIGLDTLVFGVDDVAACGQYLIDYGLVPVRRDDTGGRFEALDGTGIEIAHRDDARLAPSLGTASMLRKTVYGVADAAALDAIAGELHRDREVRTLADGSIESVDDMGFAIGFQLTKRRPLSLPAEPVNAPGAPAQRAPNVVGARDDAALTPRTLSHVVYFVPDAARAEAFYVERLGFRCTDRFTGVGPFLQPAGTLDHHTLFMIETPPFMKGCEHFTFHMGGPSEVLQAGTRFVAKGYQSFWGPGRHRFGSNWFWYFNSPFGCHVEYDADMDLHDTDWTAREAALGADTSQLFLFQHRENWAPGAAPPAGVKAD